MCISGIADQTCHWLRPAEKKGINNWKNSVYVTRSIQRKQTPQRIWSMCIFGIADQTCHWLRPAGKKNKKWNGKNSV